MNIKKSCDDTIINNLFLNYGVDQINWSYYISIVIIEDILQIGTIKDIEKDKIDVILSDGTRIESKFIKFLSKKHNLVKNYMKNTVNSKKLLDAMVFSTLTAKFGTLKKDFIIPDVICLYGIFIKTDEIKGYDNMTEAASELMNNLKSNYDNKNKEREVDPILIRIGKIVDMHISRVNTMQNEINEMNDKLVSIINEINDKLDERINSKIDSKINDLDEKISDFDNNINNKIDTKINGLDKKINGLDKKINDLDNNINSKIDTKINDLDNKIDSKFNELDNKIDNKFNELNDKVGSQIKIIENLILKILEK